MHRALIQRAGCCQNGRVTHISDSCLLNVTETTATVISVNHRHHHDTT